MKIISPIDKAAEAEPLLDAGAEELYGGYVPEEWNERFGLLASINQRTFAGAQLEGLDELREVVDRAHSRGGTFSLTLNSPFYSDDQMPLLLDYVGKAAEAGVDGIILADLGLLRQLVREHPGLEYHASTLAHLGNSEAVRFFAQQGGDRVVFPRHLSLAEMKEIASNVPEVRFDAFMLVGKCPNTEGLCTFHHCSPGKIWPCEVPYDIGTLPGEPPSEWLLLAMEKQGSWARTDRRHGCGLCAIPALLGSGVGGLKLVGRGAPTAQKLKNVLLVKEFLELASEEEDFDLYRRRAIDAHRRRFGADCSPNVCYYPEFYRSE